VAPLPHEPTPVTGLRCPVRWSAHRPLGSGRLGPGGFAGGPRAGAERLGAAARSRGIRYVGARGPNHTRHRCREQPAGAQRPVGTAGGRAWAKPIAGCRALARRGPARRDAGPGNARCWGTCEHGQGLRVRHRSRHDSRRHAHLCKCNSHTRQRAGQGDGRDSNHDPFQRFSKGPGRPFLEPYPAHVLKRSCARGTDHCRECGPRRPRQRGPDLTRERALDCCRQGRGDGSRGCPGR